jgi:uncharacterized protein
MSAAQPKSSEPSMEEILASIRRIIADEPQKAPSPPAAANGVVPTPAPAIPQAKRPAPIIPDDDEIMDLKPTARVKEPHFITDDPVDNDVSFADPSVAAAPARSQDDIDALMAEAEAEEVKPMPPPAAPPPAPEPFLPSPLPQAPVERLMSPESDRAASSAFTNLTNTILTKNARTLDDLMQEMMRPMIKQWLDDNLPVVVERLVRAEIERVARGGR